MKDCVTAAVIIAATPFFILAFVVSVVWFGLVTGWRAVPHLMTK